MSERPWIVRYKPRGGWSTYADFENEREASIMSAELVKLGWQAAVCLRDNLESRKAFERTRAGEGR